MGVTALFLPQLKIDVWTSDGVVDFDGSTLGVSGEEPCVDLEPALRFVKEVTGSGDPGDLVGKIRKVTEIEDLGAEHFRDSVILGDAAYEVVEGYIATPRRVITEVAKTSYGNEAEEQKWKKKGSAPRTSQPPARAAEVTEPRPAPKASKPVETPKAEDEQTKPTSEADELARLLLEKL